MSGFEIRGATIDDLPRIVEIYNTAIPGRMATADTEFVTVEQRTPWFRAHTEDRRPIWVLVTGGNIAAWGSLSDFYGRPAYAKTAEASVYVAPEYQGKGYGGSLFRHIVKCCPKLGVETLLGFVFAHNTPSRKMQEELGFQQWGCLPRVAVLDGVERDLIIVGLRVSQ